MIKFGNYLNFDGNFFIRVKLEDINESISVYGPLYCYKQNNKWIYSSNLSIINSNKSKLYKTEILERMGKRCKLSKIYFLSKESYIRFCNFYNHKFFHSRQAPSFNPKKEDYIIIFK